MASKDQEQDGQYWSIDIPGMTERQAVRISAMVKRIEKGMYPILADPSEFLTFHLDRASVEAIKRGLMRADADAQARKSCDDLDPEPALSCENECHRTAEHVHPDAVVRGMLEAVDEWLDQNPE